MKKIRNSLIVMFTTFALNGCEMIEYHPYDGRVKGETEINEKNIERIKKSCTGKTTIRFAVISDTQRWYDETEDVVEALNKRDDLDFVLHTGDTSDFGATKEFMWMRDILQGLKVPYTVLLGNHDCLGDGLEVFQAIFGRENYSFMAGNVRFVCLNTNALEFDYSKPVPDFTFLEEQIKKSDPINEKTVIAMHACPYSEVFNNNVAKPFELYITQFPQLQFCVYGHGHQVQVDEIFNDGVLYYQCSNIKKRKYLVFTITPEDYKYEVVQF